jgi:hypothetical protein
MNAIAVSMLTLLNEALPSSESVTYENYIEAFGQQ